MGSDSFRVRPSALAGADSWADRLRAAGLKATGSRLAIVTYLESDQGHPSAQQIFAALRPRYPSLSLSTVYETLDAFLEAGICQAVTGEGALLRVDGTGSPHDHAVCRQCGRIFDVAAGVWPRPQPPTRLPGNLVVTGMRLEYEVICSECARDGVPGALTQAHVRVRDTSGDGPARGSDGRGDRRRGVDRRSGRSHDRRRARPANKPEGDATG
jgi:Fur family peroxide stress response transcriptional regulator